MGPKVWAVLCVLLALCILGAECQRDAPRRRSGRKKITTEAPPTGEEEEATPQKVENDVESVAKPVAKPVSIAPPESETTPEVAKDSNGTQGGPPIIPPRGSRKPRPVRGGAGGSRPKPTLPSFSRKNNAPQGRMPKPESDSKKDVNTDSTSILSSTSTAKPSRGFNRRRNNNNNNSAQKRTTSTTEASSSAASADDNVEATTTEPKKKFGGRRSRGSMRYSPAPQEA